MTETMAAGIARLSLFQDAPAEPRAGSLFEPTDHEGGATGGWMRPGTPSLPMGDLLAVAASPALFALPGMFAMQVGRQFFEQWAHQLPTAAMLPFGPTVRGDR